MKLLLVEDEPLLSDALLTILQDNGYDADAALTGEQGLYMAETGIYDMIVLDRMLPGIDGLDILRILRRKGHHVPVILLTARDTVADRVEGLDAGADDYLVKPFASGELLARLRALSRRPREAVTEDRPAAGNLWLDTQRCEAWAGERVIHLTYKETLLLELFLRKKGQTIPKEQIMDRVWGLESVVEMNNIEIYIHYLRKKLAPGVCGFQIETIRNMGYCLKESPDVP